MTPEIRILISGVIFMTKYTKEIKLAIYHEWVDDHRRGTYLYLVDLIQKHGEDILDRPQQKYTADFKLAAIDRVLLGGEALSQVFLDLGLTNTGILANWLRSFKENGYTVITKKKGRPPKNAQKQGQTADQRTGRAGKEAYSRACIHKKITQTVAGNISTKYIKPLWLTEESIKVCPGWVILLMTA